MVSTGVSASSARVSTGYARLDEALQGGFLTGSAVVLGGSTSNELFSLISGFKNAEKASLVICSNMSLVRATSQPSNVNDFFLVCGERVTPSDNVHASKNVGFDNLTELSLDISELVNRVHPTRVVFQIVSDVLLRHGALQTRRWVNEQLNKFRGKGITTLGILNPEMHTQAESTAILDIFDGNLEIVESIENEPTKIIRVKWMHGIEVLERDVPLSFAPASFVPIRQRRLRPPNNLPTPPTPLIGREKELSTASPLLVQKQTRLLTLTGPGGSGKTRLALEIATKLTDKFPNGVFFVPLDSVRNTNLVLPTIAATLGVKETGGRTLNDTLKDFLRDKQLLLLLDNFEQVATAAPVVSELLAACPEIAVLATSRVPLRIRGEHEFPLPPLAIPDLKHIPSLEVLSQYGAVHLFIERAIAVKPDFAVTDSNAPEVAEICSRLDGLPLAIELAAARIRTMPPSAILGQMEKRLRFLTGGARDLPARQQTLRGAIAWSYDLLHEEEGKLFRRISVFLGGCSMKAAEAVCNADRTVDIMNGVESLVAKNLLRIEVNGESRIVMLETIREYALERLAASDEVADVQGRHANFFVELSVNTESAISGPDETSQMQRLDRELGNLRATLSYLREHNEAEKALRMGGALRRFWLMRGYVSEGRMWLAAALAIPTTSKRTKVRARAILAEATLAHVQGDLKAAETLDEEGLSMARDLGDPKAVADSLTQLGDIASGEGNMAKARALHEESLTIGRRANDKTIIEYATRQVGWVAFVQGDFATARASFEEGLAIAREIGDKREVAAALNALGRIAWLCNRDYTSARGLHTEALKLFRELEDTLSIAFLLKDLGELASREGDLPTAQSLCEDSLAISRECGYKIGIGDAVIILGSVAHQRGDYEQAKALSRESLVLSSEAHDKYRIAGALESLAEVALAQNLPERASQLFGAVEELLDRSGNRWPPIFREDYEIATAAAREKLGQETHDSLMAQGRAMTLDEAIAYALEKQTQNNQ